MTPKDILTNPYFCPMPWSGLMYNFDGQVKNCIRSSETIGNVKESTIEDIVLGDKNLSKQNNIQARIPVDSCRPCYELENGKSSFDIISDRVFYIRELKETPPQTYCDKNFDIKSIDVRWTNLCNFSCVYCSPMFSSKWASELGVIQHAPSSEQYDKFKNYIFDNAHKLKHVYMAGGEPLLMKENLELLGLLQKVNPNVKLRINTNLSKTDTKIFDEICKFKNVHWTVSVETMGDEFEYIRHGGKWEDFLENLRVIQQTNHKISFNMLHFLLNYYSIFECVDFLKGLGFHNNSFVIGSLIEPEYLNIRHLPVNVLQLVQTELQRRINEKPGYLLEDGYKNVLNYTMNSSTKDLEKSFTQLSMMDERRNLDSSKIFKDLYKLKKENNHGN